MEKNLYREIKALVERKKSIRRQGLYIKHDKSKQAEFEALVKEYNEIDEALKVIEKEFFISALMLEKIISKNKKKDYKFKIFRRCNLNITNALEKRLSICYTDNISCDLISCIIVLN